MRRIKKALVRVALVGAFALAMFGRSSTAHADYMSPESFYSRVVAAEHHMVLPAAVRGARTPSKPVKVKPPIGITATGGTFMYLKSRHRDPVFVFEIKVSRAAGSTPLTVNFSTVGSNATADSLFQNVSGEAIFHGSALKYKIVVPVLAPLTKDRSNYIALELSDPINGVLANTAGVGLLVSKGNPTRK